MGWLEEQYIMHSFTSSETGGHR